MSCLANEYELSQYAEIEVLDKNGKVHIVKDIRDKSIWVKKEIDKHSFSVYSRMRGIKNKNITYIKDVLCCNENYYVIEEYINGVSIKKIIEDKGPMELNEVRGIVLDLCDGVSCLHSNKIIHRDITAANVIISTDGTVKLIDFGISRIKKYYKPQDTTILGTVGYAAPEQYGFNQTDVTSDIYAIGILMNFMLTGEFPDKCKYNGKLSYITNTCTNMNPQSRYQSINELKVDICSAVLYKKDLLRLPGFRSKKLWKTFLSLTVYFLFAFIMICIITYENIKEMILFLCIDFGIILIPFFLISDYANYIELIPFIKNKDRLVRRIFSFALAFIVVIVSFSIIYFL